MFKFVILKLRNRLSAMTAPRLPYRDDTVFAILAFGVFFIPLAFSLYIREPFETVKLTILLLIVGAALLALLFKKRIILRYHSAFFLLLALFLFSAFLSTLNSVDVLNSLVGNYYRFTSGMVFYIAWSLFVVLLFFNLDEGKYRFLIKLLVLDSFIIAIFGLLQSMGFAFYEGLNAPAFARIPSLMGNANFSSMFIASVLPFALVLWAESRRAMARIYYGLVVFIIVWAIVIFNSRAALAAAICIILAGLGILLWRWRNSFRRYGVYFIATIFLVGILSYLFLSFTRPQIVNDTLHLTDDSAHLRILAWSEAWVMVVGHPWTGVGLGSFLIPFEENRGAQLSAQGGLFDDAHNLFLHLAATGGIPHALFFSGLVLVALVLGYRRLHDATAEWGMVMASLLSILGLVISMSFGPVVISCWLLLGLVMVGLVAPISKTRSVVLPWSSKWALGILAIACIGAAAIFLTAEYIYYAGESAYGSNNFTKAHKLMSWASVLNPTNQRYLFFKAYSELYSGQPVAAVAQTVNQFKRLHPHEEASLRQAGNLEFLLYKHSDNAQFLTQAIIDTKGATALDPQTSIRYIYLYNFYLQRGNKEQAIKYLKQSLVLDPSDYHIWMLLAKLYQEQNKKTQTLWALGKAYKLSPNTVQIKRMLLLAKQEPDIKKVPIEVKIGFAGLE